MISKSISYVKYLQGGGYLKSLFLIFLLDGLLLDDEPLWEPIEWSLVQTWLFFMFLFAWMAEVIFSSRYGSHTSRDKVVWMGLHKTYWLIQLWFMINLVIVTLFVTLPFYYEKTYSLSYMVLWWNWYNSIFFFKLISLISFILLILHIFYSEIRWISLGKTAIPLLLSLVILCYLFFFTFFILFFGFFTDINGFYNSGWVDSNQLTGGPLKWDWGTSLRDHFSQHQTTTTFWFKNDPLIAGSMLLINLFFFISLFFLILHNLAILRVVFSSKALSYSLFTSFFSAIRNFLLFLAALFFFPMVSVFYQLTRFPDEFKSVNRLFFVFDHFSVLSTDALCAIVEFFAQIGALGELTIEFWPTLFMSLVNAAVFSARVVWFCFTEFMTSFTLYYILIALWVYSLCYSSYAYTKHFLIDFYWPYMETARPYMRYIYICKVLPIYRRVRDYPLTRVVMFVPTLVFWFVVATLLYPPVFLYIFFTALPGYIFPFTLSTILVWFWCPTYAIYYMLPSFAIWLTFDTACTWFINRGARSDSV